MAPSNAVIVASPAAVLCENLVSTDFIGPLGAWTPCCQHEDFAFAHGPTDSQSDRICMVQSDSIVANFRAPSATRRI